MNSPVNEPVLICAELDTVPCGRFIVNVLSVTEVVIPLLPKTVNVSVLRFKVSPPVEPLNVSVDAIPLSPEPSPVNEPVNDPVNGVVIELNCNEEDINPSGLSTMLSHSTVPMDELYANPATSAYVLNDPVRNVVTEFGVTFTLYCAPCSNLTAIFGTSTVKFSSAASLIITRIFGIPVLKSAIYYLVDAGRTTKYPSRTRRVIEPLVILMSYTYFLCVKLPVSVGVSSI